jgi:hypothetical protein
MTHPVNLSARQRRSLRKAKLENVATKKAGKGLPSRRSHPLATRGLNAATATGNRPSSDRQSGTGSHDLVVKNRQSRHCTRSPPAWRSGPTVAPNWKFQTGWGQNSPLEYRQFTIATRVQSHRQHSRTQLAAPVCPILTTWHKNPCACRGCTGPFSDTGGGRTPPREIMRQPW